MAFLESHPVSGCDRGTQLLLPFVQRIFGSMIGMFIQTFRLAANSFSSESSDEPAESSHTFGLPSSNQRRSVVSGCGPWGVVRGTVGVLFGMPCVA